MTVSEDASGLYLHVRGPESARATYHFKNMSALMVFAESQEARFREAGFNVHAVAERRGGGDRRRDMRPGTSDRRQS
jgi:hypothetical protein